MGFKGKSLIDNLGKIITGKTPSTKNSEYWNGNIPFITPKDLQGSKHIISTERKITKLGAATVKGSIIPINSVCVSCIGVIGYVGITTEESVSNQQINSIIVNENNDTDYVYYLMKWLWPYFKNYEGQSTTLSILNKTHFSKIEIPIHPLDYQRKVSKLLSMIDDKIELNQQINRNLEEQAQAIYKSWFLDFEPFGGEMPNDWRAGTAGEILEFYDSKRIPLSGSDREKMAKIYPYYGATSLMDYVEDYIFDGVYLLLGEDGTVVTEDGFPVLQYVDGKFWVNNHAHILTGRCGFSVEALYLLFSLTNIKHIVTGAVQPKISQTNLKKVEVIIPPETILRKFDDIIQPMFAIIRNQRAENLRLTELRDALLPRLMSGEIDVSSVDA